MTMRIPLYNSVLSEVIEVSLAYTGSISELLSNSV